MKKIAFKRGSTFAARVGYTPGVGGPETLADIAVTSEVRTPAGSPVATLVIVKAADGLSFTVDAPEGTSGWPYGAARWDLKFNYQGVVFFSETVGLDIQQEVTK